MSKVVFYPSKSGGKFGILGLMGSDAEATLICKEFFFIDESERVCLYCDVVNAKGVENKEKERVDSGFMLLFLNKKDSTYTGKDGSVKDKPQTRLEKALIHILTTTLEEKKVYEGVITITDSAYCDTVITGESYSGKKYSDEMLLEIQEGFITVLREIQEPELKPDTDGKQPSGNGGKRSYSAKTQLQVTQEKVDTLIALLKSSEIAVLLCQDEDLKLEHLLPFHIHNTIPEQNSRELISYQLAVYFNLAGIPISLVEFHQACK